MYIQVQYSVLRLAVLRQPDMDRVSIARTRRRGRAEAKTISNPLRNIEGSRET
jgi:hypothetical protein